MTTEDSPCGYGPRVPAATDLTYNSYLKVEELVALQHPRSDPAHHDEMLFIVIHQTYELWFKLILHEMENAVEFMRRDQDIRARHFINRVVEIMRVLVQQIHILETMAPEEFLQFRYRLKPASGFQSVQYREVEFMLGLKDPRYLKYFAGHLENQAKLQQRLDDDDLRDVYFARLRRCGMDIPENISLDHLAKDGVDRQRVIDGILVIHHDPDNHLPLYLLTETLIDLDVQMSLWREHHVRVVERVIGARMGTGGSSGVGYLRSRTQIKCFPLLWEARTHLQVTPQS